MRRYVKASTVTDGYVGIWWYTRSGEIWAKLKPLDSAEEDGPYLQYSVTDNHLTLWRSVVNDNCNDNEVAKDIISTGYKSIERGRVIYDMRSQSYIVICSEDIIQDADFKSKILEYFNLLANRTEFEALGHYHIAEITGNPAIDAFEYGI